jgi:hypothetical protein
MKKILALVLALALLLCLVPSAFAAGEAALEAADTLHTLGLFNGIGENADGTPIYDLDRAPSRNEAVTMLVRLLGKEEEALAGTWETPFTDLDDWVKPYVGYAYANGLTYGTSATTFGGAELVSATQYLTFVLRALGYDSSKDFAWNEAWKLSDELGLTNGEYSEANNYDFVRGDVAEISRGALDQKLAASEETLLDSLIDGGAVSQAAAEAAGYETYALQEGDVVYVKATYIKNADNPYLDYWALDNEDDLRRLFPTAYKRLQGHFYREDIAETYGIPIAEQAVYDAVNEYHHLLVRNASSASAPSAFKSIAANSSVWFLADRDGNILAYADGSRSDPEAGLLAFVVYRPDVDAIWREITTYMDEIIDGCSRNSVYADLNEVLSTERDGDTWHNIYLNGVPLTELPGQYGYAGFNYGSTEYMLSSEKAFRAEFRWALFHTVWLKCVMHGRGVEWHQLSIACNWYSKLRHAPGTPSILFLVDGDTNILGYFFVDFEPDYTVK